MKLLAFSVLALALLSIEAVVVKSLSLDVARIDVSVALVVYLGLRGTTMGGVVTAFWLGYLLDVFTGKPTWLYPFLAVLTFVLVRAAGQLLDGRSRWSFALFVAVSAAGHSVLAFLLTLLTSPQAAAHVATLWGIPLQVALTTTAAVILWPLFQRLEPGERPMPGVLT